MHVLSDINTHGRRVLLRVDFNVPLRHGKVESDARIRANLATINKLHASGAQIILLSHLGRPKEGSDDPAYSLAPVAQHLGALLKQEIPLVRDWHNTDTVLSDTPVQMLENVRFCPGEHACDTALSKRIASFADIFVMDAFATAHRAHASTVGAIKHAKHAVAGYLFMEEIKALQHVVSTATNTVAVVGGAKVSGKLELLTSLARKTDCLLLGGGILNTFLCAKGFSVGKSLFEPELVDTARAIMNQCEVLLPADVVLREAQDGAPIRNATCADVQEQEMIVDIGKEGIKAYSERLQSADRVVWNGPMGIFEDPQCALGTYSIARAIADCRGYTVAGGGDTMSAIERSGIDQSSISYISTAGGAFLEYLGSETLPALDALKARAQS